MSDRVSAIDELLFQTKNWTPFDWAMRIASGRYTDWPLDERYAIALNYYRFLHPKAETFPFTSAEEASDWLRQFEEGEP